MSEIAGTFRNLLEGKTALVTGGTSGIGAAKGRGLAAAGAQVAVTGVSRAEVDAAKSDAEFAEQFAEALDVRDEAAVNSLIGGFDRLDVHRGPGGWGLVLGRDALPGRATRKRVISSLTCPRAW